MRAVVAAALGGVLLPWLYMCIHMHAYAYMHMRMHAYAGGVLLSWPAALLCRHKHMCTHMHMHMHMQVACFCRGCLRSLAPMVLAGSSTPRCSRG